MDHFILDGRYEELLSHYNLNIEEALRKANVPEDCFKKLHPTMSEKQYYDFMAAIGAQIDDPYLPIKIATTGQIESFSPPIFAAYSSRNGLIFIKRLATYKKLIGPLSFKVKQDSNNLSVTLTPGDGRYALPSFLVLSEFAFLVGLLRKTTKTNLSPQKIVMTSLIKNIKINNFFGCTIIAGKNNTVAFSKKDLQLNFISYNRAMWDYFKPELAKRLSELSVNDTTSTRVRSALTELLPSGEFTINDVAKKLGYSKRTLQRKLSSENTTFQKQLNSIRKVLALNYLKKTDMTSSDIAYLLGYQELNSFLRAFNIWKGMCVSEYREKLDNDEG